MYSACLAVPPAATCLPTSTNAPRVVKYKLQDLAPTIHADADKKSKEQRRAMNHVIHNSIEVPELAEDEQLALEEDTADADAVIDDEGEMDETG